MKLSQKVKHKQMTVLLFGKMPEKKHDFKEKTSSAKVKHIAWRNINQEYYLVYEYAEKSNMSENRIWTETNDPDVVKHIRIRKKKLTVSFT